MVSGKVAFLAVTIAVCLVLLLTSVTEARTLAETGTAVPVSATVCEGY
jgi:hypothetical protein